LRNGGQTINHYDCTLYISTTVHVVVLYYTFRPRNASTRRSPLSPAMERRQRLGALLVSAAVLLTRFETGCNALFMIKSSSCQSYKVSFRRSSTQEGEGRSQEHVHNKWTVPAEGLSGTVWDERPKSHLTSSKNATLPIALMVLAPELFPTRSKAMRAIRYVRANDLL
jgi:hypothetical protein